jgi:DNA replication factor GINS
MSNNAHEYITINEVFNVLKKEVSLSGGPQFIEPDFYQKIANLISAIKDTSKNDKDKVEKNEEMFKKEKLDNQIKKDILDLFIKIVSLLFVYRCKKTYDINKTNGTFDYSNLTDEEKYVIFSNREREYRMNIVLNTLLNGYPKTLQKIVSSVLENYVILRFLDSMEQFVGVNMNKYGPFKKEDVAILPFENARSIIENKKAVEINMLD